MEKEVYSLPSLKQITIYLFALFALLSSVLLHFGAMFIMAIALLMILFLSYAITLKLTSRIECIRELPNYAFVDEPITNTINISSGNGFVGLVDADDQLPKWIKEQQDNINPISIPDANHMIISTVIKAEKRGVYELSPIKLTVSDPMGFYTFNIVKSSKSKITVFPQPLYVYGLNLRQSGYAGEHQFEGTGTKGSGLDFHGVRQYQSGDELRRVHWPSTARHGYLNVIEFEYTKVEDVTILLDLENGTEFGSGLYTTLEYGVRIAAALAEESLSLGSPVKLLYQEISGPATESGKGTEHLYHMLEALAGAKSDSNISFSRLLINQLRMADDLSSLICIGTKISKETISCLEMLNEKGITTRFIYLKLPGKMPDGVFDDITGLTTVGTSVAVVECSQSIFEGQLIYEYAN